MATERFVDHEVFEPLAQAEYERLRPANEGVVRGGLRAHLRNGGSACVFFRQDRGCTLSVEARPLLCRLYPFEIGFSGAIHVVPGGRCLADALSPEAAMVGMDTSPRTLRRLHRRLIAELAIRQGGRADRGSR